ncbi:MAG: DNRLRE domain-containing protein, partial [Planctomycetota bacterium]
MLNLRRDFLFGLAAATGVIASPISAAVLTPSADGTIRGGAEANNVQGGGTAGIVSVLPADNLSFARKAYIRFDLSSFTGPITDAELAITFSFSGSDNNGLPINVYAINDGVTGEDTWDETTLTWNNAPSNVTTGSAAEIASGVVASE